MGSSLQSNIKQSKCPDVVKVERLRLRPSPGPAVLVSSSPWDVFTVSSARVTTPPVLVPEPPSIWPPSWSTSPLRSSSILHHRKYYDAIRNTAQVLKLEMGGRGRARTFYINNMLWSIY